MSQISWFSWNTRIRVGMPAVVGTTCGARTFFDFLSNEWGGEGGESG